MQKDYFTVSKEASVEIEERKSKFIGYVKPVETEEDALLFLDVLRKRHSDATHNCYAYFVCGDTFTQRFSDDGEPSGTAGMPILEVIRRNDIQNVVIVVTRYFGGILLGASGLVRAYSKAASEAVVKAGRTKHIFCREIKIIIEYTLFGKFQNMLMNSGYIIRNINYRQKVEIIVTVPLGDVKEFKESASEAANGNVIFDEGPEYFCSI